MQIFGRFVVYVRSLSITLNQILNGASQVIILAPFFLFALFVVGLLWASPSGSKKPRRGIKTSTIKPIQEQDCRFRFKETLSYNIHGVFGDYAQHPMT